VIASPRRSSEDAPALRFGRSSRRSVCLGIGSFRVVGLLAALSACGGRFDETDVSACDSFRSTFDNTCRRTSGPSVLDTEDAASSNEAGGISPPDASDSGGDATVAGAVGEVTAFLGNAAHTNAVADPSLVPPLASRWTVTLGPGVSYPLVAKGLAYVTTTGVHTSTRSVDASLFALDVITGKTVWSVDLGGPTAASIAYDQGCIFELDESNTATQGLLRAFDAASGTLAWQTVLDPNQGFYDAPPVAYGGGVYVTGAGTGGDLYAYDEATGALTWRTALPNATEGSPAVSDGSVFIFTSCAETVAYGRSNGSPVWEDRPNECTSGVGTPVLSGGSLYTLGSQASGQRRDESSGAPLGTFDADLPPAFGAGAGFYVKGGVLYASSPTLATTSWTFAPDSGVALVPLVVGPYVYVVSAIGTVFALDAATGHVVWSEATGTPFLYQENFTTEPRIGLAAGNGVLLVPAADQLLAYASAGPSFDAGVRQERVGDASCLWGLSRSLVPGTGSTTTSMAVADMNGDGVLDLVTANAEVGGGVSILLGNGDGTFRAAIAAGKVPDGGNTVATGDLNGDGKPDVVVASTYAQGLGTPPSVLVLLGHGDGSLEAPVAYTVASSPEMVIVGDLNSDGKPDIAVGTGGSDGVSVLLNNGDGTFAPAATYKTGHQMWAVALGDVNGDDKPDLVTADADAADITVLINKGDGTFANPVDRAIDSEATFVAIRDVSGDSKADLVVASGSVEILLGNGDGTFQTPVDYRAGADPSSVAVGDLDRDGKSDLVVTNEGAGSVSIFFGNGDGTFQQQVVYSTGRGPCAAVIADFNNDGEPDVGTCNGLDDSATILLGTCGGGSD
jgi:outer membrane protein assembly factor BamB